MSMTYVHTETLGRGELALINEWELANANEVRNVRPGEWDDTFNLQDLEFIYDHICID